jgi:hypothetical protein
MHENRNEILNEQSLQENNSSLQFNINDGVKDFNLYNKSNETKTKFICKKKGRKIKSLKGMDEIKINSREKRVHNKFSNDNIRRRIKALFHDYIIKLLNHLVKKKFKRIRNKFVKLNSRITKDVGIVYNRNLLNKKIKDIIVHISKKYLNKDNNIRLIRFIESQQNIEEILNILNMEYKDLYSDYYLKSTKIDNQENSYEAHKEKILALYGKEYLDKYIKNVENFVEFFMNGKNRKNKKTNEIKSINIPLESESTENTYNNELINKENDKSSRKFTSIAIQTDISDINAKIIVFS